MVKGWLSGTVYNIYVCDHDVITYVLVIYVLFYALN